MFTPEGLSKTYQVEKDYFLDLLAVKEKRASFHRTPPAYFCHAGANPPLFQYVCADMRREFYCLGELLLDRQKMPVTLIVEGCNLNHNAARRDKMTLSPR